MTTAEQFWAKVDKTTHCWEWTGCRNEHGYGLFRGVTAHRFAWGMEHGLLEKGKVLLHLCDNRRCVRLEHLQPGTQRENMEDMRAKRRERGGVESPGGAFRVSRPGKSAVTIWLPKSEVALYEKLGRALYIGDSKRYIRWCAARTSQICAIEVMEHAERIVHGRLRSVPRSNNPISRNTHIGVLAAAMRTDVKLSNREIGEIFALSASRVASILNLYGMARGKKRVSVIPSVPANEHRGEWDRLLDEVIQ